MLFRAAVIVAMLALTSCAPAVKAQARMVDNLRIQDATRAHDTAQRKGDALDICVKARLVAAAYEDARETGNAQAWRSREREACDLAAAALGVTRPGR